MWNFFKSKSTNDTAAVPAMAAVLPVDREAEAHAEVVALKAKLAELDAEMLRFKSTFKVRTDKFGRLLGCESPGLGGFTEIEREWRTLLHKRDSLIPQWYSALHRWANEKEMAKGAR